jgi:hypothetical protein
MLIIFDQANKTKVLTWELFHCTYLANISFSHLIKTILERQYQHVLKMVMDELAN